MVNLLAQEFCWGFVAKSWEDSFRERFSWRMQIIIKSNYWKENSHRLLASPWGQTSDDRLWMELGNLVESLDRATGVCLSFLSGKVAAMHFNISLLLRIKCSSVCPWKCLPLCEFLKLAMDLQTILPSSSIVFKVSYLPKSLLNVGKIFLFIS